jgi:hypothetical protein
VLIVCVYCCRTYYKAVRVGEGDSGGHVLRETTSRGLCGLVYPSRTGTREEPGTLTQGGASGDLQPTQGGAVVSTDGH